MTDVAGVQVVCVCDSREWIPSSLHELASDHPCVRCSPFASVFDAGTQTGYFICLYCRQHRIIDLEVVIGSMPNKSEQIILRSLRFLPDCLSCPLISARILDQ